MSTAQIVPQHDPNMGLVLALFILFQVYFSLSQSNVDINVTLHKCILIIKMTGDMLNLCIVITFLTCKPHAISHLKIKTQEC